MKHIHFHSHSLKHRTTLGLLSALILCTPTTLQAQTKPNVDLLPYGHMDQWINRRIPESFVIGGETKSVYAVGPTQTIEGAIPYKPIGNSPWATSNVMAKVVGIVKTNTSVFPERHGTGFCARLDTRIVKIKVLGMIDMTVLATGSLYLGEMHEPITDTKNPNAKLAMGIPFDKHPKALQFDYKIKLSDRENRLKATGFSKICDVEGKDYPTVILLLQKRWEDKNGNIYAKRIGTIVTHYEQTTDWIEKANYPILYGDICQQPNYDENTMGLHAFNHHAVNSKGKSVPIQEVEWGTDDDQPTHLILQFTSSHGDPYIGSPGNSFWVDNIGLIY